MEEPPTLADWAVDPFDPQRIVANPATQSVARHAIRIRAPAKIAIAQCACNVRRADEFLIGACLGSALADPVDRTTPSGSLRRQLPPFVVGLAVFLVALMALAHAFTNAEGITVSGNQKRR